MNFVHSDGKTDFSFKLHTTVIGAHRYLGIIPLLFINFYHLGVVLEVSDPCRFDNGGCTHICSRTDSGTAECSCSPGYDLQADGRTCSG